MSNLKIVRDLKKAVTEIGVSEIARVSNIERATIYFHLKEDRADKANLNALKKIQSAVDKVKKKRLKEQLKLSRKKTAA